MDPIDEGIISVGRLIATVGTAQSQQRVRQELVQHSSKVKVLLHEENCRAIEEADVVVLAAKPNKRGDILGAPGVRTALGGKLLISIMAGVSIAELRRVISQDGGRETCETQLQLVRAMPNMAAKIRQGVTRVTADWDTLKDENLQLTAWIFNQIGQLSIGAENTFDMSAVLVGCAGSLLLLAIDGLLDAAVIEGIKRSEAQDMVVRSAIGILNLIPAGHHPSLLREKIASPGGCSIRALAELERQGVRSAFTDAILAAAARSKDVSKAQSN